MQRTDAATAAAQPGAGEPAVHEQAGSGAPGLAGETPAFQPTATLLSAFGPELAAEELSLTEAVARNMYEKSKLVEEGEAAEMLSEAARCVHEVIVTARRALAQVSPQRLKEATEVVNEKRMGEGTHATPQQRPRRGSDPVVTLMKLMVSASSLLQRVLNRLHPKLRKAA